MAVQVGGARMDRLVGGEEMAEMQLGTATERMEKMVQGEESKFNVPKLLNGL
jgi:hypothetical protein